MEELKYIIEDSTIAELLGRQNFTTQESAVLELIKNAYDAKAKTVSLNFESDSLIIEDDGDGMSSDDVKEHWMHVGFSDKGYDVIDDDDNKRILAGSKGIGRFALSRLGKYVKLISKKDGYPGLIWKTDWQKSTIQDDDSAGDDSGTTIIIKGLSQNWTKKRTENLISFLKKTYNDTSMAIKVNHPDVSAEILGSYFPVPKLGNNCLSKINLTYSAASKMLLTNIISDEFKDEASQYCPDVDIHTYSVNNSIADEENGRKHEESIEELSERLSELGDFTAEFYFSNSPSSEDAEKFLYKHKKIVGSMGEGVILYRNAFSISAFEGRKDWLGFGKRVRKSPASPSHPTGSWRVRENQISGFVLIDKSINKVLKDLSNRQGLEEDEYYDLFVDILHLGISNFERYRQKIVRCINAKNKIEDNKPIESPIVDRILSNPDKLPELTKVETRQLAKEIKSFRDETKASQKNRVDVENRYKYDVRVLNSLSTVGLKASSIAHEMRNDRNTISSNVDFIIKALKEYGLWEELCDDEHTRVGYRNIPKLLEDDKRVSQKLVTFMDTMLLEIQKNRFLKKEHNVSESLEQIKKIWCRDYSWIDIDINIDDSIVFPLPEDVIQVIIDNLILNSIQQNKERNNLHITIDGVLTNDKLHFVYRDDGKGLDPKYNSDPRRILDVHETTRDDGHGLGMWIVNNTLTMFGGEISDISTGSGFSIKFEIEGME